MAALFSVVAVDRPLLQVSVGALLLYSLYCFVVYPTLLSPLRKIPSAHWSASFSPLWILLVRYQRRENAVLLEAHRKLGPVIRLGPSELSVDDIDAVRTIYQGGFEKPRWYSVFDNYGVPCMFSTMPGKEHSLRKRMISNAYSKSYIQSSQASQEQARAIIYDRIMPIIEASAHESQHPLGIDVQSLFLASSMDFITAYIFGLGRSTNFLRTPAYRAHWLHLFHARANYPFFNQELPRLTGFFSRLRFPLYPRWVDAANAELGEWNRRMCTATMASGVVGPSSAALEKPDDEPVVLKALVTGLTSKQRKESDGAATTAAPDHDLSVASELFDHVLAGFETSGITLTYLAWELSRDQALQRRLRAELLGLEPNMQIGDGKQKSIPNPKALDSLPLLQAILQETLRLHAAIPGPQPRQTPEPSCTIGPYQVPGGVRIAASVHTLHRDARVFPDPERWDHTRWLEGNGMSEETRKTMNRQFWAFSSGGRMCIGSNFALNQMKLITAAIYSNYTTHIVDDDGIEQDDGYTVGPKSGRLYIRFEPSR